MSIVVITPTRGRPDKARESYETFLSTKRLPTTKMVFVVDADDETFNDYVKAGVPMVTYEHEGGGMGPPMNAAALDFMDKYDIIGFVGDDHRFRTEEWDQYISEALHKGGLAYGNDLARRDIPTAVFISSDIVRTLGWFCLPGAKHLYLDNTWAQLGRSIGRMYYLPSVIIEHAHAFYGKSEMDEGYRRVNHPSMYAHDAKVYEEWNRSGKADEDIEAVKAMLQ